MLGLQQIFGKETIVGLDIGSRFMKVALAEPTLGDHDWKIVKTAVAPTPPDSVRDGVVVDIKAMSQAIRDLLRVAEITATGVATAISGSSVIVRHVKLPKMNESFLRKGIRYEAKQYISSNTEDSMIEFEITGPVPGEDDKMGVMLVAVPNDMVETRLASILGAGLQPVAVDIEAFALQRALFDLSQTKPGDGATVALLDIGALTTDVNIITNGQFALTRNIAIAGDSFTNALKPVARQSEREDVEALKHQVDMASLLDADASPEALALAQAIQPTVDELLREVRRSINYYQSQLTDAGNSNLPVGVTAETGGATVGRIIISGGSAQLGGLARYMSARLGIPVEVWNVFDNPSIDSSVMTDAERLRSHTVLGTAIGLALKEYIEHPRPRRSIRKTKVVKSVQ
jgi:type IV pilus assembly protein PilM